MIDQQQCGFQPCLVGKRQYPFEMKQQYVLEVKQKKVTFDNTRESEVRI